MNSLKIGDVSIRGPVFMAPMAGITDRSFRALARKEGCPVVASEMISAQALLYNNRRTVKLLEIDPSERPISVQIFGSKPEVMAEAAAIVEDAGADLIDINMGCPVPKIVRNGEGAALMRDPDLAASIVRAVVRAVKRPVTVKMRKGWDSESVNAPDLAELLQEAGAAAIAVHGRTRCEYYSGRADWGVIARVKERVAIPVIGNGDVDSPFSARRMIEETGCDAVMIGRASLGDPGIFGRVAAYLLKSEVIPRPDLRQKVEWAFEHLDRLIAEKGETLGVKVMRKHMSWYVKGYPGATEAKRAVNRCETREEMRGVITGFAEKLGAFHG